MADYDGDGHLDLVSGSSCCQGEDFFLFYVFFRKQDGSFADRRKIILEYPLTNPTSWNDGFDTSGLRSKVSPADWNCDGQMDIIIGGNTSVLAVAWGPLARKDKLKVELIWPTDETPFKRMTTNPCLADWDGDGLADLIVGGELENDSVWRIYWFPNVGTKNKPKLAEPQPLLSDRRPRLRTTGICVADWNGDGHQDLIASRKEGNKHNRVWVYLRQSP